MGHLAVSHDCQVVQWAELVSGYRNQVTGIMAQRGMEKPSVKFMHFIHGIKSLNGFLLWSRGM